MAEATQKQRKMYIDMIRIIGCLMVMFNHTSNWGFHRYVQYEFGSFRFFFYMLLTIGCKTGVPLFFMITGTLLLNKNESFSDTLKRLPKIVIDLFLFSLLYYKVDAVLQGTAFSLTETLHTMFVTNYWHLWYLYAYAVLIICLPFTRKFVKGLDLRSGCYMLCVAAFFKGIMPIPQIFYGGGVPLDRSTSI